MRPSVIIADDDPFITQLLSEICDSERMDVRVAIDGSEVLSMLDEARPDLVLLDIMMPNMNGYQVLEEMSVMPAMQGVAVIVISAVSDNDAIRRGYELGASDYFIKPFRVGELLSRLRTHLRAVSYQRLPGVPLDHDLGGQELLAPALRDLLDKEGRGPLSLLQAGFTTGDAAPLELPVLVALAQELRLQVRGVDRLFLMDDRRLIFALPNTAAHGVAALQERLQAKAGEHQISWKSQTVAAGEEAAGMAEELATPKD